MSRCSFEKLSANSSACLRSGAHVSGGIRSAKNVACSAMISVQNRASAHACATGSLLSAAGTTTGFSYGNSISDPPPRVYCINPPVVFVGDVACAIFFSLLTYPCHSFPREVPADVECQSWEDHATDLTLLLFPADLTRS